MNITIVADVFGKQNNGTTITIRRLIDGLRERGHSVKVVSSFKTDEEGFVSLERRHFGIFDNYIYNKNQVELAKPDRKILTDAIKGSDVVHIVLPFKTGIMASKICKELNIPFTTAFHCQPENFSGNIGMQNFGLLNNYLYSRFKNRLYKRANRVHCPSLFISEQLKKHGYKTKNYVISNGVVPAFKKMKVDKPENLKDKFVILFSARFSKEKMHKVLLRAIKFSKYKDNLHLIFAGCGPMEDKIKAYAQKHNIDVELNFYSKDDLVKVINYSDLYVHPSEVEIEAISCLEAITCGLVPVIANSKKSATTQFALTYDNLFENKNSIDLASKIDYWIEHPEEKSELSDKYLNYSKQFSIERSIDKMIEMFEDEIKEHSLKE